MQRAPLDPSKNIKYDVPTNFYIKLCEIDPFFFSISIGLKYVTEKIKIDADKLRLKCKAVVMQIATDISLKPKVLSVLERRTTYNTIADFISNIEVGVELGKLFKMEIPILGQIDVEGAFICQAYNIQIHLIECIGDNQLRHFLVNKDSFKEIQRDKVDYDDRDIVHIVKKEDGNYEVAIPMD